MKKYSIGPCSKLTRSTMNKKPSLMELWCLWKKMKKTKAVWNVLMFRDEKWPKVKVCSGTEESHKHPGYEDFLLSLKYLQHPLYPPKSQAFLIEPVTANSAIVSKTLQAFPFSDNPSMLLSFSVQIYKCCSLQISLSCAILSRFCISRPKSPSFAVISPNLHVSPSPGLKNHYLQPFQ